MADPTAKQRDLPETRRDAERNAAIPQEQGLQPDELQGEQAADLPDREAMSLVNANIAAPVNVAAALNVLSDNSVAYANAEQTTPITQST